jgi:hypothetical protein
MDLGGRSLTVRQDVARLHDFSAGEAFVRLRTTGASAVPTRVRSARLR